MSVFKNVRFRSTSKKILKLKKIKFFNGLKKNHQDILTPSIKHHTGKWERETVCDVSLF